MMMQLHEYIQNNPDTGVFVPTQIIFPYMLTFKPRTTIAEALTEKTAIEVHAVMFFRYTRMFTPLFFCYAIHLN